MRSPRAARSGVIGTSVGDGAARGPQRGDPYGGGYVDMGDRDFVYWLKTGFAFTLPLLVLLSAIVLVMIFR